jgi:hypothetical protein
LTSLADTVYAVDAMRTIARFASGTGLALFLGGALVPLGCGGGQEMAVVPSPHGGDDPGIPAETLAGFRACAASLKEHSKEGDTYSFQLEVEVTEWGQVERVKHKDSYPEERGIESCMAGVVKDMQAPPSVVWALRQQAEAPAGSPLARGFMGAGPAVLASAPLLAWLAIGGAVVIVGVAIYFGKEAIEAIKKKDQEVEEMCQKPYRQCLGDPWQPEWNRATYGDRKDCGGCLRECRRHAKWNFEKCPISN